MTVLAPESALRVRRVHSDRKIGGRLEWLSVRVLMVERDLVTGGDRCPSRGRSRRTHSSLRREPAEHGKSFRGGCSRTSCRRMQPSPSCRNRRVESVRRCPSIQPKSSDYEAASPTESLKGPIQPVRTRARPNGDAAWLRWRCAATRSPPKSATTSSRRAVQALVGEEPLEALDHVREHLVREAGWTPMKKVSRMIRSLRSRLPWTRCSMSR